MIPIPLLSKWEPRTRNPDPNSPTTDQYKFRLRPESRVIGFFGLLAGALAVAVVPPVSTFDAPGHYFRSELISRGHLRPIRWSERQLGGLVPVRHARFVDALWKSYWERHQLLTYSQWSALASQTPGDSLRTPYELTNIAVYSPANYIPQAIGMALNRMAGNSPLWGSRIACALNLFLYLMLAVFILETIPRFHNGLLLLMTSPVLLIQSATLNIDAVNFAVPLCLFAVVWKMRAEHKNHQRLALFLATGLAWWTALLKPTQILCLAALIFTPASRLGSSRRKLAWLAGVFCVAGAVWFYWNHPYLDVNIAGWFDPSHPSVSAQKAWLLKHPGDFLDSLGTFFGRDFLPLWPYFYGGVGGWVHKWVQSTVFSLSYVYLAVLAIESSRSPRPDRTWGFMTLCLAISLLLCMAVTLWVSFGVGATGYIPGLGGRYLFLPFTLGFMALSELIGARFRVPRNFLLVGGMALNAISLALVLVPTAVRVCGYSISTRHGFIHIS